MNCFSLSASLKKHSKYIQELPAAEVDASISCIWFYFVMWHNSQVCATQSAAINYPDIILDFRQTHSTEEYVHAVCML